MVRAAVREGNAAAPRAQLRAGGRLRAQLEGQSGRAWPSPWSWDFLFCCSQSWIHLCLSALCMAARRGIQHRRGCALRADGSNSEIARCRPGGLNQGRAARIGGVWRQMTSQRRSGAPGRPLDGCSARAGDGSTRARARRGDRARQRGLRAATGGSAAGSAQGPRRGPGWLLEGSGRMRGRGGCRAGARGGARCSLLAAAAGGGVQMRGEGARQEPSAPAPPAPQPARRDRGTLRPS